MGLAAVSLDDKYTLESGRVFLTGTQALVRLAMEQRRRDEAAGRNTACYISGYRGSPLGGLDQQLWRAKRFLEAHHINFHPGINEDLAATAIWGTQQAGLFGTNRYDGVYGLWYGKGPGVDRSGDALKHANLAGTALHGGVLALAGDDHTCKSSTTAHQSEYAFLDAMIPVLNPSGVQEFLDYGILGWAMSRFSGAWVAMKCVAETMDTSGSVRIAPERVSVVLPDDVELPPDGLNIRWPDDALSQERRLHRFKLPAAAAFARANGLDRVIFPGRRPRFGIVTTGKSYLDVRQALDDLGIDPATAEAIGLTVYKVALVFPLETQGLRRFAEGLDEILVVEEKRPFIEVQLRDALYDLPTGRRPRVVGKRDETGQPILPTDGDLSPDQIARVIAGRLAPLHADERIRERLAAIEARQARMRREPAPIARLPYFCSGCPHNTSTRVPEGSRALAGIGCHYMAQWMDRSTATYTQMGAEGASWVGLARFVTEPHVFVNLGDGTYNHSGLLAIRAAVGAKVNITYKILFNDAVAMTGGQPMDGELTVPMVAAQVAAEGAKRVVVVSEQPERYAIGTHWPAGSRVEHRDELDRVQRELRDIPGVTVLIYDQTCAAEKRRRRKRGLMEDPPKRVFINELVCEGCGDCGVQSNCVSILPVETEFGRKRAIDQSSCNKDMSCLKGFCPSFVTVHGGKPRRSRSGAQPGAGETWPALPDPVLPSTAQPYGIYVGGIGGTGVVTIGALLGMAAHIEGKGCGILDMTGLAQKGGSVVTHVRIADRQEDIHAVRIATGGARLILGCDMVTVTTPDALSRAERGRTAAVVNSQQTLTGDFTRDPNMQFPGAALEDLLAEAVGRDGLQIVDATAMATALMGDSIATNPFILGYTYQKGLIPVSAEAIERAIELNAVAVEPNKRAFLWGRRAAHDPAAVQAVARPATVPALRMLSRTLDETIARRVAFLTGYQDAAYAKRYLQAVETVRAAEAGRAPGRTGLAEAVARSLFKLMAYKDEYEVARLYTDGTFEAQLAQQFEGDYRLEFNLAPPGIAERDPETGHLRKRTFGSWMLPAFRVLAKLRRLRGTAFDPFGRTAERRMERRLIAEYEAVLAELTAGLDADNHALAVELAGLPQEIRGFGHVKEAALAKVKAREAALLESFRRPSAPRVAAE